MTYTEILNEMSEYYRIYFDSLNQEKLNFSNNYHVNEDNSLSVFLLKMKKNLSKINK